MRIYAAYRYLTCRKEQYTPGGDCTKLFSGCLESLMLRTSTTMTPLQSCSTLHSGQYMELYPCYTLGGCVKASDKALWYGLMSRRATDKTVARSKGYNGLFVSRFIGCCRFPSDSKTERGESMTKSQQAAKTIAGILKQITTGPRFTRVLASVASDNGLKDTRTILRNALKTFKS